MASVHQVLKRLVARTESPYVQEQLDGLTHYKFDPSRETARARFIAGIRQITANDLLQHAAGKMIAATPQRNKK